MSTIMQTPPAPSIDKIDRQKTAINLTMRMTKANSHATREMKLMNASRIVKDLTKPEFDNRDENQCKSQV